MIYERTIETAHLKAMALLVDPKNTREILRGIHVHEFSSLMAGTGAVLGVLDIGGESYRDVSFTIPVDTVTTALRGVKHPSFIVSYDTDTRQGTLSSPDRMVRFVASDVSFPDVRRVIPEISSTSGVAGDYDFSLLDVFQKVATTLRSKNAKARIYQNGRDAARVEVCGYSAFRGAIATLNLKMFTPSPKE